MTTADTRPGLVSHRGDHPRVAKGSRTIARGAVTIPSDPAIVDGMLFHDLPRPATQRAWLAAVARGL